MSQLFSKRILSIKSKKHPGDIFVKERDTVIQGKRQHDGEFICKFYKGNEEIADAFFKWYNDKARQNELAEILCK